MINPKRNVPKAVTYSVIVVALIYLLFVAGLVLSVPHSLLCNPNIPIIIPLSTIFPNVLWLLKLVHISILSAILGTIHSMIWSSSALALSLAKLLKSKTSKALVQKGIINSKTTVFLVGICILASFVTFKNMQFFCLTALFLVFAYSTSIITLLTIKKERQSKSIIVTLIGLGVAGLIFIFALQGIIEPLIS